MNKKPQTVMMVLNRNKVLTSLQGHSIRFEKDVPVAVPMAVVREALEIGALHVEDEEGNKKIEQVTADPDAPEVITDPIERERRIREAIEVIVKTNEREDFNGTGAPHAKAVNRYVPFDVQQRDVNKVWQKIREEAVEE